MPHEKMQHGFALPAGFSIRGYLGHGSYGCVFLATRTVAAEDGTVFEENVAVKRVGDYKRLHGVCTDAYRFQYTRRVAREVEILFAFRNNYEFIELKEVYLSENREDLYIVMPFVENSLLHVLRDEAVVNRGLDENIVKNIVRQILLGLRRMKECNVMHRDLTPSNVLVNASGTWDCYLADFGLGRIVECADVVAMTRDVVTLPYRPPEVLMQCAQVDNQVDVWSLGCITVELLRGAPFLHMKDHLHQLAAIIMRVCGPPNLEDWRGRASGAAIGFLEKQWEKIVKAAPEPMSVIVPAASAEAAEVLEAMLRFDPAMRATPEQLLDFPWFQDAHSQEEIQGASVTPSPTSIVNVESMTFDELVAQVESRATLVAEHGEVVEYET